MIRNIAFLSMLIILFSLINNCFSSSTDEFSISIKDFSLKVSWGLGNNFGMLPSPGYFFDLILLCNQHYARIEQIDEDIHFYCTQTNKGYKINFYTNGNFAAYYETEKESEIVNKILEVLTDILFPDKWTRDSSITLFMVSIPNPGSEKELLPLLSSTELYFGASMGVLNNTDGYTFFYFFRRDKALHFINNKLKSKIIIFNEKQFTKNNINIYFNETFLNRTKTLEENITQ